MFNIVIPASNEAALIGPCLTALLASRTDRALRVIVVANGCRDGTAGVARGFADAANAQGWELHVIELPRGHKPSALNAGDRTCGAGPRAYLDADITVSPDLIEQVCTVLDRHEPVYVSGTVRIPKAKSAVSRAYGRIYARVPFMTEGVPGCGLFAVNPAGRARWGDWPDIISDDTFARLHFVPAERHLVPAPYDWPVVDGWSALVRVRRRQEAGVAEITRQYPALPANDDVRPSRGARLLSLLPRDPSGVAVYAAVNLWAKLTHRSNTSWSRGR